MKPLPCFHVSDLHGREDRYRSLFDAIAAENPAAVFLGGDLLPSSAFHDHDAVEFVGDVLTPAFSRLKAERGSGSLRIFIIPGNDDTRRAEPVFLDGDNDGLWSWVNQRTATFESWTVFGYGFVPPTPFMLKDWERYDVSRFVDPGCLSPEEGHRSVQVDPDTARYSTIAADLIALARDLDISRTIALFHSPPYKSELDRAELDGKMFDHVPLDVHVGSIAIERFIRDHQPAVTLHGHVHESTRLTGSWRTTLGSTHAFSAAHDGPELALVRFDPGNPEAASRELI